MITCTDKLPKKFTANEIAKLPENVIVKGPNGIIWHVSLLSNDSNHLMLTGDVWKEFVKAYSLQKNDLVIFKYDRTDKSFEVFFIDQTNSCERESSYFVRKFEQPQYNGGLDEQAKSDSYIICSSDSTAHADHDLAEKQDEDERRESNKDRSTSKQQNSLKENESTPKEAPSNFLRKRKSTRFDKDERDKRRAFIEDDSTLKKNNSSKVNGSNSKKTHSYSAACDNNSDDVPLHENMKRKSSTDVSHPILVSAFIFQSDAAHLLHKSPAFHGQELLLFHIDGPESKDKNNIPWETIEGVVAAACYRSNRRPVTDAEKEKALALASKNAIGESFIMVMRPSHVYKRFSLVIPQNWKPKGFSRDKRQDVILRTNNNTWVVSFCTSNNHGYGGFEGGWKKFAFDNFLEEFDLCLFVPGGQENKRFVLDVSIFRVVPEITPLSPSRELVVVGPKGRMKKNVKDSARERNGKNLPDCAVTESFSQPYQEAQAMPKDSHAYPDHWSTTFKFRPE
ncbi:B3 domain-containing protein Os11g0197600-like [Chenopodium quinoa]|uniref:B3 domain-containing protein Os11g0197600-like n=1 Tax=Chenopodium quinoa TaxID=63459 RepID=UPI000B777C99|nr:B3 domain-containing protein Os11g0197600-like [Chenopodium quinoa]